jgi:hypothetical protein
MRIVDGFGMVLLVEKVFLYWLRLPAIVASWQIIADDFTA